MEIYVLSQKLIQRIEIEKTISKQKLFFKTEIFPNQYLLPNSISLPRHYHVKWNNLST